MLLGKDKNAKVPTGIEGLDKALEGGIPESNIVLLSGGCGTGKSTFCLQYLVNGAIKHKEKGLYITTEQNKEEIYKAAAQFGWNLGDLEKKKLLKVAYFDVVTDGVDYLEKIYELGSEMAPKRIVLDSLTTFTDSMLVSEDMDKKPYTFANVASSISPVPKSERIIAKSTLYHLLKKLKLFKSTVLMTTELPEKSNYLSADQVSEFICDGVFTLEYLPVGKSVFRNMRIRKMRYTDHEKGSLNYEITKNGIQIKSKEITL